MQTLYKKWNCSGFFLHRNWKEAKAAPWIYYYLLPLSDANVCNGSWTVLQFSASSEKLATGNRYCNKT